MVARQRSRPTNGISSHRRTGVVRNIPEQHAIMSIPRRGRGAGWHRVPPVASGRSSNQGRPGLGTPLLVCAPSRDLKHPGKGHHACVRVDPYEMDRNAMAGGFLPRAFRPRAGGASPTIGLPSQGLGRTTGRRETESSTLASSTKMRPTRWTDGGTRQGYVAEEGMHRRSLCGRWMLDRASTALCASSCLEDAGPHTVDTSPGEHQIHKQTSGNIHYRRCAYRAALYCRSSPMAWGRRPWKHLSIAFSGTRCPKLN